MRRARSALAVLALAALPLGAAVARQADAPAADAPPPFDARAKARVARLTGLGEAPLDPTNRFAGDARAAELGQRLFFDPRFSSNGAVACATCHDPARSFTDGKPVAETLGRGTRRTPPLWNLAWNRWYFHDGRADSLWAQALQPFENPLEMGFDRVAVLRVIAGDPELRARFEALRGPLPDLGALPAHARPVPDEPEHPHAVAWRALTEAQRAAVDAAYADVGKAIAAYERRLVSRDSAFDRFARGLAEDDADLRAALSPSAQRGLLLFVGKGQCFLCHDGPNLSDGEFHALGLAPRGGGVPRDPGRYRGLALLADDAFNAAGPHSDDPAGPHARELRGLAPTAERWGEFKTPGLREVSRRGPYMHAGQFDDLGAVLRFYSTLEGAAPLHLHQEQVLRAREFDDGELRDLEAFLRSLEGAPLDPTLLSAPH